MPDIDWQLAATLVGVFGAALYVLLRLRRFVCETRVGDCGGCGGCEKPSTEEMPNDGTHVITEDQISVTIHDDQQD